MLYESRQRLKDAALMQRPGAALVAGVLGGGVGFGGAGAGGEQSGGQGGGSLTRTGTTANPSAR